MNLRFAISDLRLNWNAGLRHGSNQKKRLEHAVPEAGAPS
jgi:hypothetical protein